MNGDTTCLASDAASLDPLLVVDVGNGVLDEFLRRPKIVSDIPPAIAAANIACGTVTVVVVVEIICCWEEFLGFAFLVSLDPTNTVFSENSPMTLDDVGGDCGNTFLFISIGWYGGMTIRKTGSPESTRTMAGRASSALASVLARREACRR